VIALVAVPLAIVRAERWIVVVIALAVIAVFMIADLLVAPNPSRIDVLREFPASLTLGETGDLRWLVQNRTGRSVRLGVADALWPSFQASAALLSIQDGR
jgi:uncharacterized protein (DUF58 family)